MARALDLYQAYKQRTYRGEVEDACRVTMIANLSRSSNGTPPYSSRDRALGFRLPILPHGGISHAARLSPDFASPSLPVQVPGVSLPAVGWQTGVIGVLRDPLVGS